MRPHPRPPKKRLSAQGKDRRCSEVVDLTAANVAADTLALAKMGDIGLGAAAAVRSPPPLPPPAATASGRCDFLRAVQVVKSGKYRVSKPVKLLAPINGVRASPNLSRLRPRPWPRPRRQPQLRAAALSVAWCVWQVGKIVCIGMNYVEHCTEQVRQPAGRLPSGRRAAAALRGR